MGGLCSLADISEHTLGDAQVERILKKHHCCMRPGKNLKIGSLQATENKYDF